MPGDPAACWTAPFGAFLPPDVEVVSTKGQMVEKPLQSFRAVPRDYRRSPSNDPLRRLPTELQSLPLVVLVSEGSASASEIVTGALRDHHRAIVMGAQTLAKPRCERRSAWPMKACRSTSAPARAQDHHGPLLHAQGQLHPGQGITPDVLLDELAEGNVFAAALPV